MPSFYIPLSGLNADSTALNTIANNLANMNTTGFKEQTTNFSDLFYQQVGTTGAGGEIQQGTGVQVASNSTDFTGGSISSTGVSTDAAIDGTGFFVLDAGGGEQLYTRDGNFQLSSTGMLESTEGQGVMGYAALNGVINTAGALTDITVPTGQVMQPSATTTFGMTQNLDSASPIGTTATGQVQVYDSLGKSYEATVTYTNLGDNKWSYAITLPDTLTAAAATAAAATTMALAAAAPTPTSVMAATTVTEPATTVPNPVTASAPVPVTIPPSAALPPSSVTTASVSNPAVTSVSVPLAGTTTDTYTFAPTGTVNLGNTSLTITGPTAGGGPPITTSIVVTPLLNDETVAQFMGDINTALGLSAITPGAITVTNPTANTLVISGPTATLGVTGAIQQDVAETTTNFNVFSTSAKPIDPASSDPVNGLSIKIGVGAAISATPFVNSVSLAAYAANLQAAVGGIASGVTVQVNPLNPNQLQITGPSDMTIINPNTGLVQDSPATTTNYTFGSYTDPATGLITAAGVDPASKLKITGPTASGTPATVTVSPTIPAGENLAQYVTDITNALANAPGGPILGVTASSANGVLSITGATASSISSSSYINQDILGATVSSSVSPTSPVSTLATMPLTPPAAVPATVPTVTSTLTAAAAAPATVTDSPLPPSVGTFIYNFAAGATVDPLTNLSFTGQTAAGVTVTAAAPVFASGETLVQYVAALTATYGAAGANLNTFSATKTGADQITITGPAGMVSTGGVSQDFTGTSTSYSFTPDSTVNAATSLTITGPTPTGALVTIAAPAIAANETLNQYAQSLNNALSTVAGGPIVGVTVTANAVTGQLSIVGPSTMTINNPPNSVKQDLAYTTTNYNFVTSNGALATVASTTNLAITEGGQTVPAPGFSGSQSVSDYATSLQGALTSAGITDVTVADNNGVLSITKPADATIGGIVNQSFTGAQSSFDFGSYTDPNTGLTAQATVASTTSLTITAPTTAGGTTTITVIPSNPAGESVAQYVLDVQNALATAKITGMTVTASNGVLTITGPDTATIAGTVSQNMLGTTTNYAFQANSTVDPTTNLRITGETAAGSTAIITTPSVTAGETVAQYAAALTAALSTAGIANVAVSAANGQLSISGANLSTTGSVNQGLADTTINYNFGSSATVDPATALTIVGPTVTGVPPTAITVAPAVIAGETVTQYAADLTKALKAAGIDTSTDGVTVTATGGQLSIVGPANTLKVAGNASQDLSATTISYNFGTSGGVISAVDPSTNLTITGLTALGGTATTAAPKITAGETLAQYVNALTNALTTAGIAGVTVASTATGVFSITGANLSTSGSIIQDPVASANASGTLTFNSSGNLVSPAADPANITFAGLSDNAATVNMTWDLYGANGAGIISQTAAASGQSAQTQNGFTSGEYQSFTIGSDGTVTATYSNGQSQAVGQLAIATVSNQQGLVDMGSTQYSANPNSGLATVGVANTGGRGTLEGSSLEASNVNISTEFSNLIVAQRAFEANAKSVTTFDTITQETINMIH
jgi:flagellar hook protein FlgE